MGELSKLIQDIKKDKDKFDLLIDKMKPLINKYVHILYKDEPDDIYSEFCCALWEAVCKISFYKNDGEIMQYMAKALHNKFHELYRISRRNHDINAFSMDAISFDKASCENDYSDILIKEDLFVFLNHFDGMRGKIYYYILVYNLTDSEISKKLNLSRQYINRMRKTLRAQLSDYFEL